MKKIITTVLCFAVWQGVNAQRMEPLEIDEDPKQEYETLVTPKEFEPPTIVLSSYTLPNGVRDTLMQYVSDFQTFELIPSEIYKLAVQSEYIVSFELKYADNLHRFDLQRNDLRSPEYIEAYTDESGLHETPREQEKESYLDVKTYKGILDSKPEFGCRFYLDSNYVSGFFFDGDKWFLLQPIDAFLKESGSAVNLADETKYVLFDVSKLLKEGICGVKLNDTLFKDTPERSLNDVSECDPKYLEIAVDADYEYFQNKGEYDADRSIRERLNQAEAIYSSTFNVMFSITYRLIRRTAGNSPYHSEYASQRLGEFKTVWNNSFTSVRRDIAILFTGIYKLRDDINMTYEYIIGGATYNTSIGYLPNSYSVIANSANRIAIAHEIGHFFGAQHEDQISGNVCNTPNEHTIMWSNVNTSKFYFCQTAINSIRNGIHNHSALLANINSNDIHSDWIKTYTNERNINWIGGWNLSTGDIKIEGDFDGDGDQELIYFSESASWCAIQDFKCNGANGPDWFAIWSNGGNKQFSSWRMNKGDRYYTGDFDGDGKDEVLSFSADNRYTHLNSFRTSDNTWNFRWTNSGSHWLAGWYINPTDRYIVSDFTGDGKEDLLCIAKKGWAALFTFNGTGWTNIWTNGGQGWIGEGQYDGVHVSPDARYQSGYITQTNRTDLFTVHGNWAVISRYSPQEYKWKWQWSQNGGGHPDVAGWWLPMSGTDWIKVANIDNDPLDEIQFIQSGDGVKNWIQTKEFNGSNLVGVWDNGGSQKLADMSLSGSTNYQNIKPYPQNKFHLLAIKNTKNNRAAVMYRTTQQRNFKTDETQSEYNSIVVDGFGYKVFPNPNTQGAINVVRDNADNSATVKLIDITGKLISETKVNANVFYQAISLEGLSGGVYFLKITDGTKLSNHKIVVQ